MLTESSPSNGSHLRLIWPQWQGGGTPSVRELAPEFPFDVARLATQSGRGTRCCVDAPRRTSAPVLVSISDEGLEERDGIEAKSVILDQLDDLRESSQRLLDWLAGIGCTRVACTSMLTPSTATRSS